MPFRAEGQADIFSVEIQIGKTFGQEGHHPDALSVVIELGGIDSDEPDSGLFTGIQTDLDRVPVINGRHHAPLRFLNRGFLGLRGDGGDESGQDQGDRQETDLERHPRTSSRRPFPGWIGLLLRLAGQEPPDRPDDVAGAYPVSLEKLIRLSGAGKLADAKMSKGGPARKGFRDGIAQSPAGEVVFDDDRRAAGPFDFTNDGRAVEGRDGIGVDDPDPDTFLFQSFVRP